MNKTVSEEEWVDSRKALLKKDSSHPDSDEDANALVFASYDQSTGMIGAVLNLTGGKISD